VELNTPTPSPSPTSWLQQTHPPWEHLHLRFGVPSGWALTLLLLAVAIELIIFAGSSIHAWHRAPHGKPPKYLHHWLGWHLIPPWRCWRWLVIAIIRRGHTHARRAVERHDRARAAAPALGPQISRGGAGPFRRLASAGSSPGGDFAGLGRRLLGWGSLPRFGGVGSVAVPRLAALVAWRPHRAASAEPATVPLPVSPPSAGPEAEGHGIG
jgi:hypothetical protein